MPTPFTPPQRRLYLAAILEEELARMLAFGNRDTPAARTATTRAATEIAATAREDGPAMVAVASEYGLRCAEPEPGCPVCVAWRLWSLAGTVPTTATVAARAARELGE